MAILIVVSALAAPSYINLLHDSRLRAGARGILAQCRFARDLATRQETHTRITFDENQRFSSVEVLAPVDGENLPDDQAAAVGDPNADEEVEREWRDSGAALGKQRSLPDGIDFDRMGSKSETMDPEIIFTPDGRADDFFLTLKDRRGGQLALRVTGTTGAVELIDPNDQEAMARLNEEFRE